MSNLQNTQCMLWYRLVVSTVMQGTVAVAAGFAAATGAAVDGAEDVVLETHHCSSDAGRQDL